MGKGKSFKAGVRGRVEVELGIEVQVGLEVALQSKSGVGGGT